MIGSFLEIGILAKVFNNWKPTKKILKMSAKKRSERAFSQWPKACVIFSNIETQNLRCLWLLKDE